MGEEAVVVRTEEALPQCCGARRSGRSYTGTTAQRMDKLGSSSCLPTGLTVHCDIYHLHKV